ncbi:MAG: hypothetical protein IPI69_16090 [Bacteroidales bacterium]|nr:hypothetical protein [Bacteroidales bacterium]
MTNTIAVAGGCDEVTDTAAIIRINSHARLLSVTYGNAFTAAMSLILSTFTGGEVVGTLSSTRSVFLEFTDPTVYISSARAAWCHKYELNDDRLFGWLR